MNEHPWRDKLETVWEVTKGVVYLVAIILGLIFLNSIR